MAIGLCHPYFEIDPHSHGFTLPLVISLFLSVLDIKEVYDESVLFAESGGYLNWFSCRDRLMMESYFLIFDAELKRRMKRKLCVFTVIAKM